MKNWISAASLAIALTVGTGANATSFVNGDFSQNTGTGELGYNTSLTGWSGNGGYNWVFATGTLDTTGAIGSYGKLSFWGSNNGGLNTIGAPTLGGAYVVALDGDFGVQPLTQSVSGLTVGDKYTLTFDVAFAQQYNYNGDTTQHVTASLGGQSFTTADFNLTSHGFSGWNVVTDTFTATATTETLSFLAYGSQPVPPFTLISGVTFAPAAVPEASTWAMMLIGFGGMGVAAHQRRRRSAAVAA
jgi:hypothetical protein